MLSEKRSYKYLIFLGLLLFLADCSVEKNTGTTRFYHGLTAKYNIYFNGYESYKAGILKINNGYRDDFSELLKVFESSDPSTVSLCSSDMERAIQKASKLISLKSITAKPEFKKGELSESDKALLEQKEFNKWVDDSYFLIGRSRFYKHEYNESAAVFNYCIAEANDPLIKTESSIWLARINNEKGNYSEAARLLNEIEITASSSKSFKALYFTTMTDMFIKQKKFQEAVEPLSKAIQVISGKRPRYRLTYLLAQLNERAGETQKAISLYRSVVKMNPPYDVEFNARINIAGVFDVSSGDPGEMKKELEKMLKDSKNNDFLDQIYYALGNLMKREGKVSEALNYYSKSAKSSSTNQNQKGKSYLALADFYFATPDYMKAGKYYDSTIIYLDPKYPAYKEIQTKSLNLNSLLTHLTIIQREDSLQKVAKMSKNERDALIAGIIEKAVKAESQGKLTDYADRTNIGQYYENERRSQNTISQEGKWYFYNQSAMTFGRTEFRRRWGDRRLEDNWRRSNKARVNIQQVANGQEENGGTKTDTSKALTDFRKPEFYLKNLPVTDSLMTVSNGKIANALFNAAKVFNENFSDWQKAAESYESLLLRFPADELVPETLYDLYNLYKENNKTKAEITREKLLQKFPESEYARIISDPEYYNKKIAEIKFSEQLYDKAYSFYSLEKFNESIALCDSAVTLNPKDVLVPKFMLLKAYSVARTSDERSFREALNKVVKGWPNTDEGKKAAELNAYIDKKIPSLKIEEDKVIAAELYTADTTSVYSFVAIIMDPSVNSNQTSFDVISYNIDNYTNKNYRTEGIIVNNKYLKITVSGFSGNDQAWEYYRAFKPEKVFRNTFGAKILTFLINSNNVKIMDVDKNPERYYLFFEENYLSGKKNR